MKVLIADDSEVVRRLVAARLIADGHEVIEAEDGQEAVELATLEWVSWFNHHRLLETIGYIPPAEAEANYWRQQQARASNHEYTARPGGPPAAPAGGLKKGGYKSRSQQTMPV